MKATREEQKKTVEGDFIQEVNYLELSNVVFFKMANVRGFHGLESFFPNDSFSSSTIDRLVNASSSSQVLDFMDAFSRYNEISMHSDDQEKTCFIFEEGTYYYMKMPSGLKILKAIY